MQDEHHNMVAVGNTAWNQCGSGCSSNIQRKEAMKMAQKVLVLGDSGTGKSASLRNFKEDEVLVINCAGKPLPFKNHFECFTPSFDHMAQDILQAMNKTNKKVIVVDDAQYIMSFQYMRRIKEGGWDKWNDIQGDFFNIIKACDYMSDDVIVFFLSHLQRDDEGHEKIKTMGKMLDEKITIEGLFTTVLKTSVVDGQYFFLTQNSGKDTVKSPIGMFDTFAIDNDLRYVDMKIRNYYEVGEYVSDTVMKELDESAQRTGVEKPDPSARRRRSRTAETPEAKVQKEPEKAVVEALDENKLQEIEDITDQRMEAVESIKRMNRTRVRKDRNGKTEEEKPAEAPAEEAQEEASSGTTGRRRRMRKERPVNNGFVDFPDGIDEELPFI